MSSVIAIIVTLNRRELLLEGLAALAAQSQPLTAVVVVDNSSTDGTEEALRDWAKTTKLRVHYMRKRNGGGPEAWHYGVEYALTLSPDWLWFMDDDAEAQTTTLQTLLDSEATQRTQTVLVAPQVITPEGAVQSLHRGHLHRRWLRPPMVALQTQGYDREQRLGYATYVGPLIRASAIASAGLPVRDWFMWVDDTEYSERLSQHGDLWLVPAASIIHKDGRGKQTGDLNEQARKYLQPIAFNDLWRNMYGLRNLIFWGRERKLVSTTQAYLFTAQYIFYYLCLGRPRWRCARLCLEFTRQGFSGDFINVTPTDWKALASTPHPIAYLREHAISYEDDTSPAVTVLN